MKILSYENFGYLLYIVYVYCMYDRANLIENMHRQYVRSGYVWEQYDDNTGQGKVSLSVRPTAVYVHCSVMAAKVTVCVV